MPGASMGRREVRPDRWRGHSGRGCSLVHLNRAEAAVDASTIRPRLRPLRGQQVTDVPSGGVITTPEGSAVWMNPARTGVVGRCQSAAELDDGTDDMPLEGEYEPSPAQWVREQVELYESSGGTKGTTLLDTGLPVVLVTTRGANSGK